MTQVAETQATSIRYENSAFLAAGRTWSAQNTDIQIGTLPLSFTDGITKYLALAHGVCLTHSRRLSVN